MKVVRRCPGSGANATKKGTLGRYQCRECGAHLGTESKPHDPVMRVLKEHTRKTHL